MAGVTGCNSKPKAEVAYGGTATFSSEYFDDLPAYILDTETMLMGINRKNRNVNDYNRAISGN